MAQRKSIYTDGFSHSTPIPAGCRLGNLLVTGIVNGIDPARPDQPGTLEEQCALVFARVREVMAAAGATTDHIVKINVAMADIAKRAALDREWIAMFPDPDSRPARQTTEIKLDRGKLIQCDVMAWLGE